jgi:fatty-acyl-CoA synthase
LSISREHTQRIIDVHRAASGAMMMRADFLVPDCFEEQAARLGERTALIYEGRRVNWSELERRSAHYARVALVQGLRAGDVGAVMIENRPEFFYAWLGLARIGAVAALINTSALGAALAHALRVTQARLLFIGDECMEQLCGCEQLPDELTAIVRIADPETPDVLRHPRAIDLSASATADSPDGDFKSLRAGIDNRRPCFYVFTSGTTGLPKAALISHGRFLSVGAGWLSVLPLGDDDVFYCALPLFHGAALMSLYSTALQAGGAVLVRRRFSVSRFWPDVQTWRVSVFQYVGEVIRYLVNVARVPEEEGHTLKLIMGSGVGIDVWVRFKQRFGEHVRILEGWGATESNANMSNFDQKPGSCGRIPYPERSHIRLLRYDQGADELLRDDDGAYVLCGPGEVGELYGQIRRGNGEMVAPFEGYTTRADTEAKVLRDVFEPGDAWWRSGDLFRFDEDGYFYFVDRIGDTFRWKGENVSTTEVAQQLSAYDGAETINIYGVKVPGREGRACMAALELKQGRAFDPRAFYRCVAGSLPVYAQPLFVRVLAAAEVTANFKLRKVRLREEGFDAARITDPLWGLDRERETYAPLDAALLARLCAA